MRVALARIWTETGFFGNVHEQIAEGFLDISHPLVSEKMELVLKTQFAHLTRLWDE